MKPHVLFVTEKWCDYNPAGGPTNCEHNLFGSLDASNLATQERFHYDEYNLKYNRSCDSALIQLCAESKPDLLFYSWCGGNIAPRLETLGTIKEMKIAVAIIWWESNDFPESVLPFVDLNVVLSSNYMRKTNHSEKYLLMWTSQDPRIYHDPEINRDINISFVGSINNPHYTDRRSGIENLRSNGINIYVSGGQREHKLSVHEYANIFMRSKISLNFCRGWPDTIQAKGRIFEITSCGAMLLEADNPETRIWFEPMIDYVPFIDNTDLVKKVRYYLEHDSERKKIAESGNQKAETKYNCYLFWDTIFCKIFGDRYKFD